MIKTENFPNAYKEVYVILGCMNEKDVARISPDFIDIIKKKMNKEHIFFYNPNLEFGEQKILRETKAILAYIFMNFWADENEKVKIKEKYKQDILEDEKRKKETYKNIDVFNKRKSQEKKNNREIIKYKEENVLKKIWRKILKKG